MPREEVINAIQMRGLAISPWLQRRATSISATTGATETREIRKIVVAALVALEWRLDSAGPGRIFPRIHRVLWKRLRNPRSSQRNEVEGVLKRRRWSDRLGGIEERRCRRSTKLGRQLRRRRTHLSASYGPPLDAGRSSDVVINIVLTAAVLWQALTPGEVQPL